MSYGSTSYKTYQNKVYDPLGASQQFTKKGKPMQGWTGAVPMRSEIFDTLTKYRPQGQEAAAGVAGAARDAAANPGWAAASRLASDQIAGKYLHGSPEFSAGIDAMRGAAANEAADNAANIRSGFARNGVAFGTANQQAEAANAAAATAKANQTEAGMRAANYANERGIQQTSPEMLQASSAAPLAFLKEAQNAPYSPLAAEAQLIQALAGNGQLGKPDVVENLSGAERAMQAFGNI